MNQKLRIALALVAVPLLLAEAAAATICVIGEAIRLPKIGGIVVDFENRVLPGVEVSLWRRGHPYEVSVYSDEDGAFHFGHLPHGNYVITARLEGFGTTEGVLRVQPRGGTLGKVLVIEMNFSMNDCAGVRPTSVEEASRIQRQFY